jgi:hypothetical protein
LETEVDNKKALTLRGRQGKMKRHKVGDGAFDVPKSDKIDSP